jgi:ribosomal protein S12 methylthiotransferase
LIQEIQLEISLERNESFVGKTMKVLVDTSGEDVSVGRTEYDSPEIDNIVHIQGKAEKGTFVNVKIEKVNEYELIGTKV